MNFAFSFIFVYVFMYLFCLACCVVILVRLGDDIGRDLEVRYFRVMLYALMAYCVVESVWAVGNFGFFDAINQFTIPLSVFNHCMVITMCYCWFCFVEARLHSRIVDEGRLRLLSALPMIAAVLITASSIFNGGVFFLYPDGAIGRGPLYPLILVLSYGYAAVATVRAVVAGLSSASRTQRHELLSMTLFAVPPAVVGVIDSIVPLMPVVAPAFLFSFLIIFTVLQDAQISNDVLTGLNNRRRADRYFEEALERASKENPLYYFIIDADDFKTLNDTYGHLEGDRALRIVAASLKDACRDSSAFVARWGGDEFVVLAFRRDIGDPEAFAARIDDCLLYERLEFGVEYNLRVTIGYAECASPKMPPRQILAQADKMLYERKRSRK